FMWENAPRFRAMVIFAEHRYYGQSMPYGKKAFKDLKNTGYLTAEQALADFAELIQDIKQSYKAARKSPVIVFGGSYGGMLSAWFRMKYPHLAEGALAASAPIWQFPGIYECDQFYKIITRDFERYSEKCAESVRKSWKAVRNVWSSEQGREWLSSTFKLCKKVKEEDIETFMNWLRSTYENLAMVDYPNPSSFLAPLPAYPIKETCQRLRNPNQSDKPLLQDLYKALSVFYNYTGETKCNDIEGDVSQLGTDAWDFQSCTEMVMPVCSDGVNDMFEYNPWNVTKVSSDCQKRWKVTPEPLKAELIFGGLNISAASNIIFSNGNRDPWSAGGVLKSISSSLTAIHIPNACHHEDLRPSGANDPPALLQARQTEVQIIKFWINNYYERINFKPRNWLEISNMV
ncbi:lysosomal Pro-X carboxypeptidase-like protein, partial [Leptotrombidium deliense]